MKYTVIAITLLFLVYAQIALTQPKPSSTDSIKQNIVDLQVTIEKLRKVIEEDKNEKDTACVIHLKGLTGIKVYDNDEKEVGEVTIEKVVFDIREGIILDMQVLTTDKRVFSNYRAPIGLTRYDRCDWLGSYDGDIYQYIKTCDFSYVIRKGIAVPDNDNFSLPDKDRSWRALTRAAGINQVVDLRYYSDLLGTIGKEPNGIAQVEGSTRISINNLNWYKSLTPFRYGYFSVQASKLDSRFQVLKVDSTLSRVRLIQQSWFNVDIGANIFGFWLQRKSRSWASLNGGGGVYMTRLGSKTDTTSRSSQYVYLESLFEFKELKNFGIDFGARILWQTVPGLEKELGKTTSLLKIGATAYWSPLSNKSNRIFGRVNLFQNLNKSEEPFVQFQIGYSAVISSLLPEKQ